MERAYFSRVARQADRLKRASPPDSLAEMFARLDQIRAAHGQLAQAGIDRESEGDLPSHLAFLARVRKIREREARKDAVRDEREP